MTVSFRVGRYLVALLLHTFPCLVVGVLIGYLAAAVVAMNVMQSFDKELQKAISVVAQQCAPIDPTNATAPEPVKGRAPGLSEHASPFGQTEARAERTLEHPPP